MLIELNGLSFHLVLRASKRRAGLVADIVDEAFMCEPRSRPALHWQDVTALIESYAGIKPTPRIERAIQRLFLSCASSFKTRPNTLVSS
ncbi:hypothetical protein E4Z66_15900 [Aliishimia ponticola]|uniref:Uncharacterized protein n=1 Tax=Aliishimia ponticola TaxID=2499833 RepID=A0A4S4NGU4_9RHOB|nr:hypothetical protein [Aliishimia ponticola]THH35300.1 hypothetical protein E4Z66_15900 [Aliishimia ponticola]